jgi:hypothetical protein
MKQFKYLFIITIFLFFFAGCAKRNFFPDTDDPGLSLLTSHGYNVATNYINGKPYINPFGGSFRGNYLPTFTKIVTNSTFDTLSASWLIVPNDGSTNYNFPYQNISLLMPIPKSFSKKDFLLMGGKRLLNTNTIQIQSYSNFPSGQLSGTANVYFVKITTDSLNYTNYLSISGLFDGNIGDSILITKGRFDFEINADNLNF